MLEVSYGTSAPGQLWEMAPRDSGMLACGVVEMWAEVSLALVHAPCQLPLEGKGPSIRSSHTSQPLHKASHPRVQDWVIRERITLPPSHTQGVTPDKVINNTFSLGKSPKKRVILTTVKSISMTAPETSKNQLPSKVGSLTKGQRLLETTGGYFKMVTGGRMRHNSGGSQNGLLSTNLRTFDKTILSVIWLLLSMYLTALQGTLFLFQLRNSYIVFFRNYQTNSGPQSRLGE